MVKRALNCRVSDDLEIMLRDGAVKIVKWDSGNNYRNGHSVGTQNQTEANFVGLSRKRRWEQWFVGIL